MKKLIAEFIGTAVLVTLGCGTAMLVGCNAAQGCGYILTALAFGLVIVGMAYCVGNISGCHINPAVSIAMLIAVGFCNSVMWTCVFILATQGLGRSTNLAAGVFMMMVFGGGVIPALQGRLVDVFGSFQPTYVVGAFCLAFILGYALFVRKSDK